MDAALEQLTVSPELAVEFFAVFSRMEYALKVTNFRHPGNGEAKADWIRFAASVSESFKPETNGEVRNAYEYLISKPLRYFGVQDETLDWFPFNIAGHLSSAERAVRLIRQVRNNLFHGGKFAPDPSAEPGRDEKLIASSLVILRELLRVADGLRIVYEK